MPYVVSACTNATIYFLDTEKPVMILGRGHNIERAYTEVSETVLNLLQQNTAFQEQLDSGYYSIAKSNNDSKAENRTQERDASAILTKEILAEKTAEIDSKANSSAGTEEAMINAIKRSNANSKKTKIKAEVVSDDDSSNA